MLAAPFISLLDTRAKSCSLLIAGPLDGTRLSALLHGPHRGRRAARSVPHMNRTSSVSDESFARQSLQEHIESFLSELQSLKRRMRQEWIHSTRVHSRRTRAALEAFDDLFPSAPWRSEERRG